MTISADDAREASLARRRALLDDWGELERDVARQQARQAGLLAERMDLLATETEFDDSDISLRSLAAEYAAAAHIPPSTAALRLTSAWFLVHKYPLSYASFSAGDVSRQHVDAILNASPEPGPDQDAEALRAEYEARVVPFAEQDTAAATRDVARGVAASLCPDTTIAAHRRGRRRRKVSVKPEYDGMALLIALLPELEAYAIKDRLDAQARQVVKSRRANGTAPSGSVDPEVDHESAAPASEAPDESMFPAASDADYDAFLADLAAEDAEESAPSSAGQDADESRHDTVDLDHDLDVPPWESTGSQRKNRSAASADGSRGPGERADSDDVVDIGDLGMFSADAAEYDRLGAATAEHPPLSSSSPAPPPPPDDDMPATDDEFEALVAALANGFPDDPCPLDPARRYVFGPAQPADPIGTHETDERTMDQIRAYALADILLTADPSTSTQSGLESIRATVQVTISATTLLGLDDHPAELDRIGPIDPEWVRLLAGWAPSLDRLFLDHSGMVTATDSYTPTANMKRFLRARDQHCRYPGCRAPANRCQADHNHDHAKGGPTALTNLALFCTGHHPLKHPDLHDDDRWTAEQLRGGIIRWTSPLGRAYEDHPPARVMFV